MLDVVNNNMMQYLIGTTELSHYLTALVDELNLSAKGERIGSAYKTKPYRKSDSL